MKIVDMNGHEWWNPAADLTAAASDIAGAPHGLPQTRASDSTLISDYCEFSDESNLSETVLTVGEKGEIYTNSSVRKTVGIRKGGKVRAKVAGNKLVIEPLPSLEDMLASPLAKMTPEEVERVSEEAQREARTHG